MDVVRRLDVWFADAVSNVKCSNETRAYIVGVLARPEVPTGSIVLEYARARNLGFPALQRLGDGVTWLAIVAPECLGTHERVAVSVARVSYGTCHRLLRGRWKLYEELADDLPRLITDVRTVISTWE
jgi:hypothetical protein